MPSPSFLLDAVNLVPSSTKLLLPIIPFGIVACTFTLLWDNLCRNSCMPLFGLVGKARQPVDETNGNELKLRFACNFAFSLRTFAENHLPSSILGSSVWWFPLLIQSLTRFSSSSLFPLNFNPLHFNHRFNWPTVYSSGSLSNLEPGTSSSSVRTVKDGSKPLAIHRFPLQPLQNWRLFVWLTISWRHQCPSLFT